MIRAPKRDGMTAKSPALRQAERRGRGARAVMLPGALVAQLDVLAVRSSDPNRVACVARLVREAITGVQSND